MYTNTATPQKERVVFGIDDPRFLNAKMDTTFPVRYLDRSYTGKKSVRMIRRVGSKTPSTPPVLEFEVTGGK